MCTIYAGVVNSARVGGIQCLLPDLLVAFFCFVRPKLRPACVSCRPYCVQRVLCAKMLLIGRKTGLVRFDPLTGRPLHEN